MKISKVTLNNFKRFTKLEIVELPESTKLVIVVGPNGCGKSSLFDAFNNWYRGKSGFGVGSDESYYRKNVSEAFHRVNNISVKFHGIVNTKPIPKGSMYFRTAYRNDPDLRLRPLYYTLMRTNFFGK